MLSHGVALALAILVSGYTAERTLAEDELPDLKVELVGLPLAGSQREIQVKVTNVGESWSDETQLSVETSTPTTSSVRNESIENLDPGQSVTFSYALASACGASQVKIRAELSAGKNSEGALESGVLLRNNGAEGVACQAKPPLQGIIQSNNDVPAATLLLPYFEVDLSSGSSLFDVNSPPSKPTGNMADDERPDLKIELVGIPLTGSQREVQIKITNVSAWWSDETDLKVEVTPVSAGSALTKHIENLDPGQSVTIRHSLTAACSAGTGSRPEVKVRTVVSAGKNYEGVPESGDLLENNAADGVACPARP